MHASAESKFQMLPISMQRKIQQVRSALPQYPEIGKIFAETYANTYSTTLQRQPDGGVFVITGDIPAMWLRDSAAQVRVYLSLAKDDPEFAHLITAVVKQQMACILLDPYANAFNATPNGHCHNRDKTDMSDWIWERKYELDSLCAPLKLAHDLWRSTGQTNHLDDHFIRAASLIVDTIICEQDHDTSPYSFERLQGPSSDTLTNNGRGAPVGPTGMSWSGFRPSDDACALNYLIPANMLAVVVLNCLAELPLKNSALSKRARALAAEIKFGIENFGVVTHKDAGKIYAYETDGLGNSNVMDDANVPSLLAMPYMGYCDVRDPIYQNTRKFILSQANPYFYRGTAAQGIGSPHTPDHHIWPIALCMQGLTAQSSDEKFGLLRTLLDTTAGTGLMHESFHKDNPAHFTRPWFAWANSLFAEFVMDVAFSPPGP
jgi:meiotically up-regulated gene 157 (Mug157) protein